MSKPLKYSYKKFVGEFVEVVTTVTISSAGESEMGLYERSRPMLVSGYMLGMDERFVYLGETPTEQTDMVNLNLVVQIARSKPMDEYEKLLDEAKEPNEYH